MSATVPWKRTNPRYGEVKIAASPRGRLWKETALLYHWIRAHGAHLVPAHSPGISLGVGASRTLRYWVHPSGLAIARVWAIEIQGTAAVAPNRYGQVRLTYPDGRQVTYTPSPWQVPFSRYVDGRMYVEPLAAKSGVEQELAITVEHVAGDVAVHIKSVCCYELPRAFLSQDATDLGVDEETLRTGAPIYDDAGDNRSFAALAANLAATEARRSLLQHAIPRVSVTSATPVTLWVLPVPILPRKIGRNDTTRPVPWDVYARASAADTTGKITLSTTLGADSKVVSLDGAVSTAFAWQDPDDVTAACEDLSTVDGRPAAGWETVQVTLERTAGTGAIELESVSAWEGV